MVKLGTFEVKGNSLVVSDPCYEYGLWCCNTLTNVLSGNYTASVIYSDDNRVATLQIIHNNYSNSRINYSRQELYSSDIGVDSGQAGFFDEEYYKENQGGEFDDKDSFYGKCCDLTLSEIQGGVIDNKGTVSSSGYGDGCYPLYVIRNEDGKVVIAWIDFIDEEENEEFDDDF